MGEVMKLSRGKADPKMANKIIREELEKINYEKISSILSIFILILNACQQNMKTPEGDFSIHAIVQGIDTVIFEKIEANDLLLIDTLFAIDGEFVVANSLEGSAFFLLRTPEGEGINLLIEKGENLEITGNRLDGIRTTRLMGLKDQVKSKNSTQN